MRMAGDLPTVQEFDGAPVERSLDPWGGALTLEEPDGFAMLVAYPTWDRFGIGRLAPGPTVQWREGDATAPDLDVAGCSGTPDFSFDYDEGASSYEVTVERTEIDGVLNVHLAAQFPGGHEIDATFQVEDQYGTY